MCACEALGSLGSGRDDERSLVGFDPLRQLAQWVRREAVDSLPAYPVFLNEPSVAEYPEMLRDRRSTHREPRRQLGHRHASVHQAVEDGASRRIGDDVEDIDAGACSGHGHIRNQLVTEFAAGDPSRQAAAL